MLHRTLVIASLAVAAFTSVGLAACPQNHFAIGAGSFSSLPVDSRSVSGNSRASASYNVPAGQLSASCNCSSFSGECSSSGGVYVEDDFSVVGLPPGTPVALTAHLSGDLNAGGFPPINSNAKAILSDANNNSLSAQTPASNYDLALPVQAIVGQTFRLHFEIDVFDLGPVQGAGSGSFSFTDLPPGAAVTSCQGYVSDPAVAARPSTWGRLRTAYH